MTLSGGANGKSKEKTKTSWRCGQGLFLRANDDILRQARHSRAFRRALSAELKKKWESFRFVITEAGVDKTTIVSLTGDGPAWENIQNFIRQFERKWLATGGPDDTSQEALRQAEKITDSKPVRGETLLRSRKLKGELEEARKRTKSGSRRR